MNNDLIERIARAIAQAEAKRKYGIDRGADEAWAAGTDYARQEWLADAQAALTAMQQEAGKPTEAMIDLAERAIEEWFATHDGEEIDCRALARIAVMQGEVGGLREAANLAMQALSAFGDTEEGVTTAYNILKDAVQ